MFPARDDPTGHVEIARSAFLLPLNHETQELRFPEGRGDRGPGIAFCHDDHAGALKLPDERVVLKRARAKLSFTKLLVIVAKRQPGYSTVRLLPPISNR